VEFFHAPRSHPCANATKLTMRLCPTVSPCFPGVPRQARHQPRWRSRAAPSRARQVNTKRGFRIDLGEGDKSPNHGIVLTWEEPCLDDGAVHPTEYEIIPVVS
jgi:hypothetical protein